MEIIPELIIVGIGYKGKGDEALSKWACRHQSIAARMLQISEHTIGYKMKKLGITGKG